MFLHASAAGPVDDDRLARLVYIVLHAKVGRHPMDQHAVVGRHVSELLKRTEKREKAVGREMAEEAKRRKVKRGKETKIEQRSDSRKREAVGEKSEEEMERQRER